MRNLMRTRDFVLTYQKSDNLEIIGYSYSDFTGCPDSRRSTSGYIFLLAEGVVFQKSFKQTLMAPSTMAIEFVACFETLNHVIQLRNFVTSLHIVRSIERLLKVYCNNSTFVLYSKNHKISTKSKFIDIKYLVVKERVQEKQILIEHIRTDLMLVDPLTKSLTPKTFHGHVGHMGLGFEISFDQWDIFPHFSMFYDWVLFQYQLYGMFNFLQKLKKNL